MTKPNILLNMSQILIFQFKWLVPFTIVVLMIVLYGPNWIYIPLLLLCTLLFALLYPTKKRIFHIWDKTEFENLNTTEQINRNKQQLKQKILFTKRKESKKPYIQAFSNSQISFSKYFEYRESSNQFLIECECNSKIPMDIQINFVYNAIICYQDLAKGSLIEIKELNGVYHILMEVKKNVSWADLKNYLIENDFTIKNVNQINL